MSLSVWWRNRMLGRKTVVERLILKAHGLTVVVVNAKAEPWQVNLNRRQTLPNYEAA